MYEKVGTERGARERKRRAWKNQKEEHGVGVDNIIEGVSPKRVFNIERSDREWKDKAIRENSWRKRGVWSSFENRKKQSIEAWARSKRSRRERVGGEKISIKDNIKYTVWENNDPIGD